MRFAIEKGARGQHPEARASDWKKVQQIITVKSLKLPK
jgi:hypothetical protein